MGIYGTPFHEIRYRTWKLVDKLFDCSSLPTLIAGDWNEILIAFEKMGGSQKNVLLMFQFKETLNRNGLVDLPLLANLLPGADIFRI